MDVPTNNPDSVDIIMSIIGTDERILHLDVICGSKAIGVPRLIETDVGICYLGAVAVVKDGSDQDQAAARAIEWISERSNLLHDLDASKSIEVHVLMRSNEGSKFITFSDELLKVLTDHGFDLKVQCFQEHQRPTALVVTS
jgi:hypothetical protein